MPAEGRRPWRPAIWAAAWRTVIASRSAKRSRAIHLPRQAELLRLLNEDREAATFLDV